MKLRIDAIEARNDGSGQVALDVWALRIVDDGEGGTVDVVIPGRHATVLLEGADVEAALVLTPVSAKVTELKRLIQVAVVQFQTDALDVAVAANDEAAEAAAGLSDFVPGLPYSFVL